MFKKESETPQPQPTQTPTAPRPAAPPPATGKPAIIGSSIHINGQITGSEDLVVEGQVEGSITLAQHEVTIGRSGRVKADVNAKAIRVEGHVRGDLNGQEEVVIMKSGDVRGNITAPRVSLENGAAFKGSIDMDTGVAKESASAKPAVAAPKKPAPTPGAPRAGAPAPGPGDKPVETQVS